MGAREFGDELRVEGFDKTHIGNGRAEHLARIERRCCEAAEGEEGDVFTLSPNNAFANWECIEAFCLAQRPGLCLADNAPRRGLCADSRC